jgi:hypothetical protein
MKKRPLASSNVRPDHWAEHLTSYTNLVKGQGCSLASSQNQVLLLKRFLAWLPSHAEISLDEIGIQRFLLSPHNTRLISCAGTTALYRFLQMLREQGVVPPKRRQSLSAQQRLIKNYERYLLEERGLMQATAVNNIGFAN